MENGWHKFLCKLTSADRQWLADQLLSAEQTPPTTWRPWFIAKDCRVFRAGLVPQDRLEHLVESLSGFQRMEAGGVWALDEVSWREASHALNAWLRDQRHAGLMSDWRHEAQDWIATAADEAGDLLAARLGRPRREKTVRNETPRDETAKDETAGLRIERAGLRHLGLRSRAVHVNGFLPDGRVWVGQRSMTKRFDPGLFDNLMAGGVGAGETDQQTFERELWEEAGIQASALRAPQWRGSIRVGRAEGPDWHSETLSVFHVDLPLGTVPLNRDGEVSVFQLMNADELVGRMRAGEFTHDGVMSLAYGLGLADRRW